MHYNVIIQKKIRKTRRFCAADKYDANGFPGNGGSEKSEVNGMATYYDDTEYERRGGGFWGKFLAVFLGFLFGIICTLGGLAGLGYVLYAKIKIAEGFKAVNKITGSDIDYTEYITEEYAQKTIAELMKDLGALSSDFQNQTASLSSLEKFSPKVRETAESIVKKISEYGVAVDTDVLMTTPLSGMSEFLTDTLNTVEVGKVLDKSGILVESNDSYEILMLLCYGEKGVDYAVDGEGRPVKDDKGNVTMLGSAAPTTVGDLTKDTNKVLDKMTLSAVMNATNSLDNSDPMIRALLYGAEGESYTYDEEKKEVTMLPLRYKYDEENNSITDADGKTYAYDETGKKWLAEDGGYILSLSAQPTVKAAAADEETVSYTYAVYTKEGTLVCSLAAAETPDTYHAFDKQNNLLKHQPLSVGDLMGGDLTGILNDIRLGDALKVTAASDAILIALAYGSEGTDYIIEDGKIKPLTPPTTIGSLTDGQTSEIFDKIELGAVMKVDPSDDVMCALAYGTKNKHYKVVEETVGEETVKTIEMLPIVYTLKDGVLFDDEGNETVSELLAGGVYKVTIAEGEGETATETIYYAKPDAAGAADYFLYETETCAGDKILYKKTTLNDLMNGDASSLIDNVELGTLMGLDGSSDKMLLSLAYGSEGVDYEIDASTNAIVRLEGGKAPTTVKDLRNDETASGLLKGLKLGDVLGISPLDQFDDAKKDPDPMMLALAYGEEGTSIIYVWSDGDDNEKAKEIADKLAYNFLIDASVHFYAYKYSDAGDVQQLHPFISSPLPTFLAISNGEIAQYQYEKVYDEDDEDEDEDDDDDDDEEEEEEEEEEEKEEEKASKVVREEMTELSVNRFVNDYAGTEINPSGGLSTALGRLPALDRLMMQSRVAGPEFYSHVKDILAANAGNRRSVKAYTDVLDVFAKDGAEAVWSMLKDARRRLADMKSGDRDYEDTLALRNVARAVVRFLKSEDKSMSDEL